MKPKSSILPNSETDQLQNPILYEQILYLQILKVAEKLNMKAADSLNSVNTLEALIPQSDKTYQGEIRASWNTCQSKLKKINPKFKAQAEEEGMKAYAHKKFKAIIRLLHRKGWIGQSTRIWEQT